MTNTVQKLLAALAVLPLSNLGAQAHDHAGAHDHSTGRQSVKTEIVSSLPAAEKSAPVVIRLTGRDGKPVTPDDLKVAHTEKLHLLIVDETLTDYHHEHPVAAGKPGEYRFDFQPRFGGTYHVWADVVPTATGKQEYSKTTMQIGGPSATRTQAINTTAESDGFRFEMSFEKAEPLRAGQATLATVKATKDGREFTQLEPVMGAFAHMVAFPADLASVAHVHPMGKEPEKATERGGPMLSFHIAPEKPGYHKIFLQTQIGGRENYASFGVNVEAAAAEAKTATGEHVCPMHPEVKQAGPGQCPKCGMDLVKQ